MWITTGNNTTFRGDLGRRVVPCDIDPKAEHPEDRTGFKHPDLLDYVQQERPRLVAVALAVLRAYHVAGRPPHGKPRKGSFEAWDDLVRGALIWVGAGDPLAGCERIRAEGDADLDALREALAAWNEAFGASSVTGAEAVERGRSNAELAAALSGLAGCTTGQLDPRRLGYALRRHAGRLADGMRFEREGRTCGATRWRIGQE